MHPVPEFIAALSTIAKDGNNLHVHQKMNGSRRCGVYTDTHTHTTSATWETHVCMHIYVCVSILTYMCIYVFTYIMNGSRDYFTK